LSTGVISEQLGKLVPAPSGASGEVPLRDDGELCRRLQRIFWSLTLLFGGIQFWISRFAMNTDGISYLDVSAAFGRHDWASGVNAYWSPLYPAFLTMALKLFHPSPYWEFVVVHLVNFVLLIGCAGAFEFFLSRFFQYQSRLELRGEAGQWTLVPEWALRMLGYALFLWTALELIPNSIVSPDMSVAMFVYLGAAVLLGVPSGRNRYRDFFLLGMIVGFGYLAKAPLLPVGFTFFAMAFIAAGGKGKAFARVCVALVGFALVAGPFIFALSHAQKRLTWGDSAKLNYAWYVDHAPRYHWQGGAPASGAALHASKKIFEQPPVYAFDHGTATYPIWYDPAYWNAGIRPVVNWKSNLNQLFVNGLVYERIVFHEQAAVVAICLFLFLIGGRGFRAFTDIAAYWILLIPPLAALGMYVLVHVEDRMTPAFDVMIWLGLFAAVRFRDRPDVRRAASLALVSVALLTTVLLCDSMLGEMASHSRKELLSLHSPGANFEWQVADQLRRAGLRPGDKVAWVRPNAFNSKQDYSWAHLAGLRIVAEVPDGQQDRFWSVRPEQRMALLDSVARTGAAAFVVTEMPEGFSENGWKPLGSTGYWVYLLSPGGASKI